MNIDDGLINSILYNAPACESDSDCNSGACVADTATGRKYCKPCVISGEPPGGNPSACCSAVSTYDAESEECVLKEEVQNGDEELRSGGIIARGSSSKAMGITVAAASLLALSMLSRAMNAIPATGAFGSVVGGIISVLAVAGSVFLTFMYKGFLMHPLFIFVVILMFNSGFFFVGFVLPIIEFIVVIEVVRTLTGALGEQIDLIQVFRVV